MLSMTAVSVESLSERELVDAAREGDDRAFEELYARYRGRITGFIHARVRDHGRSEDVAQDVFISALRRLRASTQEIQFKPWIYEIAKNACIDEHRRTRRNREIPFDSGDHEAGPSRLPSRAPTPPAAVATQQVLTDLRGAFGGLSDSHHQLLVLREFEGLSYDEIGERTGMSRQMVESALFRARRKLNDEYEELTSGRRCRQVQSTIDDGRALSASSLGVRERQVFSRHLAHCQTCRVSAHLAGVDNTLVSRRGLGAKIAALLPFPLWHWPRGSARSRLAVAQASGHPMVPTLSHAAEPAGASLGGAAVAAAVLALAGAGAVTAPLVIHADRPSTHATPARSFAPGQAVALPAIVRPVSRPPGSAVRHGRGQVGATGTGPRTGGRAPARHLRRGRRTSAASGAAGTGSSGPGATGPAATGPSSARGALPLTTGSAATAPSALTRIPGSNPARPLSGVERGASHLAAGLPKASTPLDPSAATRRAGSAAAGAGQAAAGAGQAAAGAGQAAAGAGQAAGALPAPVNPAPGPTGAASGAVTGTAGQVAGAASQAAASSTTGAAKTVTSLLPH